VEGSSKRDDPPRVYRLLRLAFGVNCSPFLAITTDQSHAKKCKEQFPDASREVPSNMCVDDCLTGADDVGATVELQQSLDKMMEQGGFNLTIGPAIQRTSSATSKSKSSLSPVPLTSTRVSR